MALSELCILVPEGTNEALGTRPLITDCIRVPVGINEALTTFALITACTKVTEATVAVARALALITDWILVPEGTKDTTGVFKIPTLAMLDLEEIWVVIVETTVPKNALSAILLKLPLMKLDTPCRMGTLRGCLQGLAIYYVYL